jgi:glycosyltransferase involved in cell wall biosynthesis
MKIVLANKFYFMKGGADRYLLELEALLLRHGHTVIPFAMKHPANHLSPHERYFVSQVETEKVKLNVSGLRTLGRMLYSREAKTNMDQLLDEEHPDLCHVHNIYYQLSPSILLSLRARGIPTVMTVHDYHMISPQYMRWSHGRVEDWGRAGLVRASLAKFHKGSIAASFAAALTFTLHRRMGLYHLPDRYIAPSHFLRRALVRGGFEASKIHVLPFGIDAREVVPRFTDEGYVLFVGRLVAEKGVVTLLRAARELPNVRFKIVGTGPEEAALHHAGDRLGNVEFLGFQSGELLWRLYRGARCVVVPSLWEEVFGLAALEAMAAGKPVIASNIGGLPEVVQDRMTGLLVPPGSVTSLAESIDRLTSDAVFAQTLGRAARERVALEYSLERHYAGLMKIYEEARAEHHRVR